ncbi:hypothetical protein [Desulfolutivibrio sulfodismutans]|uniref:hypothetical protein n=1 Tax=Desulfolutivibrio sulfodismutans TaxID=63561 RepID=UPI00159D499C|nr:hypothetical protein [Desulfolutivibrio sulfodismutans]
MFLILVVATLVPAGAHAQVACLASDVSGEVALGRGPSARVKLTKYRKIVEGDLILLMPGSRVRLTYLPMDMAEDWIGPATLRASSKGAVDEAAGTSPVVTSLGARRLGIEDSTILRDQRELVSGQFRVRSASRDEPLDARGLRALDDLRALCQHLRAVSPSGDGTAVIVYLAGLERLGQKAEMARILREVSTAAP